MNTDIETIEKMNAVELFQGEQLDPILKAIEKEVKAEVPDVKTVKGRERIKSLAHKVARTKTTLDDMGKTLVSDWKAKSKLVDASRKSARDFLDNLKEEVRKPVTDWEDEEKARVAGIEARIEIIKSFVDAEDCTCGLRYRKRIEQLEARNAELTFKVQEFDAENKDTLLRLSKLLSENAKLKLIVSGYAEDIVAKGSKITELQAVVNRLADPFHTWVKHSESNWSDLDILQADINAMQAYAKQHSTEE